MVKSYWHRLAMSLLVMSALFVPTISATAQDPVAAPAPAVDVDDDDNDDGEEGMWGLAGLLGLIGLAGLLRKDRRHDVHSTHVAGTTPVTGTSTSGRDIPRT